MGTFSNELALLAQSVARMTLNHKVRGSSPLQGYSFLFYMNRAISLLRVQRKSAMGKNGPSMSCGTCLFQVFRMNFPFFDSLQPVIVLWRVLDHIYVYIYLHVIGTGKNSGRIKVKSMKPRIIRDFKLSNRVCNRM